jgi:hypothetical protein
VVWSGINFLQKIFHDPGSAIFSTEKICLCLSAQSGTEAVQFLQSLRKKHSYECFLSARLMGGLVTNMFSPSLKNFLTAAHGFAYSQNIVPLVSTHTKVTQVTFSVTHKKIPFRVLFLFARLMGADPTASHVH